ncbi:hypothetical protein F5H01DRAFT_159661 [Linnemannia elongata]|nr:hypothetical protein F5H01DRAFT_159661 [Linnemannia elongata]
MSVLGVSLPGAIESPLFLSLSFSLFIPSFPSLYSIHHARFLRACFFFLLFCYCPYKYSTVMVFFSPLFFDNPSFLLLFLFLSFSFSRSLYLSLCRYSSSTPFPLPLPFPLPTRHTHSLICLLAFSLPHPSFYLHSTPLPLALSLSLSLSLSPSLSGPFIHSYCSQHSHLLTITLPLQQR